MKFPIIRILLFALLLISHFSDTFGKAVSRDIKLAQKIVNKNGDRLNSTSQLLVVFNELPESETAQLVVFEKRNNRWRPVFEPVIAGIGRKGFAEPGMKREGDQKSPSGLFRLGQLFCYDPVVNTQVPFIQSSADDKWIDDPDSPKYNSYVHGPTTASSWENLLLKTNDYRYCMVIEYNMHPVVKGMGSAIFLHLSEHEAINSSSGCVVVTQNDMERLLKWMNPELKPAILMGNINTLIRGIRD